MSEPETCRIGPTDTLGRQSRSSSFASAHREAGAQAASAPETLMSIHTRKLPTSSTKLLDQLVDPNSLQDEAPSPALAPSPAVAPAPVDRVTVVAADDPPPRRSAAEQIAPSDDATELPWYRRETWLVVQLAAIMPILGAMLVPASYRLLLCILGGTLVAIGTVMMLRHKPTPASSKSGGLEAV